MNYGEVGSLAMLAVSVMAMTLDVAVKGGADGFVFYTYFLALYHVALVTSGSLYLVPRIKAHEPASPGRHSLVLILLSIGGMTIGSISAMVWAYDTALDTVRVLSGLAVAGNLLLLGFCYIAWTVNLQDTRHPLPQDDPEAETQRVLARVDGLVPPNE